MPKFPRTAAVWPLALALTSCSSTPEGTIQRQLSRGTGQVQLPDGPVELSHELRVPPNAKDLEIVGGKGTVLRAAAGFQGRAVILIQNAERIRLRGFRIDGNRAELERPTDIPPAASPFLNHFQGNGIAVDESKDILITDIGFRELPGFAVLASRVKKIRIEKIAVEDSGGRSFKGRNNTTGGVLLEEGTDDFEVVDSSFRKVLGNGVWTHSTYLSPRNFRGRIANNRFELIGRDAVQVGHANRVRVEGNTGKLIGYPHAAVDVENMGTPVGVDTSGKVDEGAYTKNRFEDVNGKCFDLDGFHDGEVSENTCINRGPASDYPHGHYALVMNNANKEMESQLITVRDNVFDGTRFGGIFIIGKGHKVVRNKLLNLNKAHCNEGLAGVKCEIVAGEPNLTQAGIYLGLKGERSAPAAENVIEDNEIAGFGMAGNCVMAANEITKASNTIRNNRCSNTP